MALQRKFRHTAVGAATGHNFPAGNASGGTPAGSVRRTLILGGCARRPRLVRATGSDCTALARPDGPPGTRYGIPNIPTGTNRPGTGRTPPSVPQVAGPPDAGSERRRPDETFGLQLMAHRIFPKESRTRFYNRETVPTGTPSFGTVRTMRNAWRPGTTRSGPPWSSPIWSARRLPWGLGPTRWKTSRATDYHGRPPDRIHTVDRPVPSPVDGLWRA